MATYLRQKDIESAVLTWIQEACIIMLDEVCPKSAESPESISQAPAVLKGQKDEWATVCELSYVCSAVHYLLWL
jgi:hypothetical protein